MNRTDLAAFLRSRRLRLRPSDVGLPDGTDRRTPGLRREEVAELAGMSTDYYVRLEQARGPRPSAQVLSALGTAFRLTSTERGHLFALAGQTLPAESSGRSSTSSSSSSSSHENPPNTMQLIDELVQVPAQVFNQRLDVLGTNRLAEAIIPHAVRGRNLAWQHFAHGDHAWGPDQWEPIGRHHVAQLQLAAARNPSDQALTALVRRLRTASPEFATFWDRHDVDVPPMVKRMRHPVAGSLEFRCTALRSANDDDHVVVALLPGSSRTTSALQQLATDLTG